MAQSNSDGLGREAHVSVRQVHQAEARLRIQTCLVRREERLTRALHVTDP